MYTAGLQMFASQNDSVYFRKRVLMGLSKRPWHHKRKHLKESPRGKAGSKRRKAHNIRPKLTLFQRCSFFFLFIACRPTGSIRDSCVGNKFHARTSHEYIFYYFPSLPFFSPNWHGIHTYFTFYYFLRTCCSWRRRAILGALRLNDFKGFSWGFQRYLRDSHVRIIFRLTFSCLNRVNILISRNVRWQYVWCSNGDIFLMATFVFVTLS